MKKIHVKEDDFLLFFEKSRRIHLDIQPYKYIAILLRKEYLIFSRVLSTPLASSIFFRKNEKIQISEECLRKYLILKRNI